MMGDRKLLVHLSRFPMQHQFMCGVNKALLLTNQRRPARVLEVPEAEAANETFTEDYYDIHEAHDSELEFESDNDEEKQYQIWLAHSRKKLDEQEKRLRKKERKEETMKIHELNRMAKMAAIARGEEREARRAALAAGVPYVPLDEQLAPKVKKGAGIWSRSEAEERSTSPSGTMIHAGSSTTAGSVGEQQQLFTRRERVYSTPPPPTIITGNAPATFGTGNYVPVGVVGTVVKDSGQQQLLSKSRGKIQFVLCGKDSSDARLCGVSPREIQCSR